MELRRVLSGVCQEWVMIQIDYGFEGEQLILPPLGIQPFHVKNVKNNNLRKASTWISCFAM